MPDTFAPAYGPTVGGYNKKIKPNVLENEFGDGYTQRAGAGINRSRRMVTLTWAQLTAADKEDIEDFMNAHDDGTAWLYTLPDEDTERKWQYIEMDAGSGETPDWYSLSVAIKQVFDL